MKALSLLFVIAGVVAALWAKHELSVGGQFDLESTAAIAMVFFPFGLVVLLPLILPVIFFGIAIAILFAHR